VRASLGLAWAFVRRDLAVARSYRFPFVLGLVASAGILLVVHQVGDLVDPARSSDPTLRAGYFSYVLVGTAVLTLVASGLQSFAAKLREEQVSGTFEALLTTPAPPSTLALSLAAYDLLQALASALVVLVAGAALGAVFTITPLAAGLAVVLLAGIVALAAAVGILVASFTVVFKRGGTLAGLVSAVIALLGGIYFPVAQLPGGVRWAAEAMPFTWGITALRSALIYGEADVVRLGGLLAAAGLGLPAALLVFRRAVARARRQGTLSQY
jgi:ABC-type polysaccharide/polyol phosphate export permease